jgi:hypothetical protein
MKTAIVAAVAAVTGVIIGYLFAAQRDAREMALRAHSARALFRVAERHVGHERLIVEWRKEAQRPEHIAVPEIDGRASR